MDVWTDLFSEMSLPCKCWADRYRSARMITLIEGRVFEITKVFSCVLTGGLAEGTGARIPNQVRLLLIF